MPRRAITLISTTSSWVSILGGQKAAIFAQVGQFYFDEVGQYYSGANNNATRACEIVQAFGSLAAYFWRFEPAAAGRPGHITRETLAAMPPSGEALALSKDLKRRGFTFVGPTTVYAFMQAMGLVNDHVDRCPIRAAAETARAAFARPRAAA